MRDCSVASRNDGVPSEMFTSDTARMQAARVAELQELSADDAIPTEMTCGETTRIDATALTGLIEISEGIAVGTPKRGLPRLESPDIEIILARGSTRIETIRPSTEPIIEPPLAALETVPRPSRIRDVLIGGALSIAVMAAWFCATQL
jgi:hypothetical protein